MNNRGRESAWNQMSWQHAMNLYDIHRAIICWLDEALTNSNLTRGYPTQNQGKMSLHWYCSVVVWHHQHQENALFHDQHVVQYQQCSKSGMWEKARESVCECVILYGGIFMRVCVCEHRSNVFHQGSRGHFLFSSTTLNPGWVDWQKDCFSSGKWHT